MSMSKNLYRRLPYFVRRHLSRSQSFCLVIVVVLFVSVFIFYETILGFAKSADDIYQERSAVIRETVSIPVVNLIKQFTIVIFDSRVILTRKLPILRL